MALSYSTTGSAGTGRVTVTGDGTLTLATLAANSSAVTNNGDGTFTSDREIYITATTATGITFNTGREILIISTSNTGSGDCPFNLSTSSTSNVTTWNGTETTLLIDAPSSTSFLQIFGFDSDTRHPDVNLFACTLTVIAGTNGYGFTRIYRGNPTAIVDNCTFINWSGRLGGSASELSNTKTFSQSALAQLDAIAVYENIFTDGANYAVTINSGISLPATYKNITATNVGSATVTANPNFAGTRTYRFLNIISNQGRSVSVVAKAATNTVVIAWDYSVNSEVSDEAGVAIQNVRRCIFDGSGTILSNTLSDASGVWVQADIEHSNHSCNNGSATLTSNGPFEIRYGKYGFYHSQKTSALTAPLSDDFGLLADTGVMATEATALGYSGVSVNFSTKTITVSSNRTWQEVYDYAVAQYFQSANFATKSTTRPCTSSDAVNFTMNTDWDLVVNTGVTVTADGQVITFTGTGGWTLSGTAMFTGLMNDGTNYRVPIVLSGIADGSRYRIETSPGGVLIADGTQSGSGDITIPYTITGATDVLIRVRQYGYLPFSTTATVTTSGLSSNVAQVADTIVA